jgi:hypothetical protein
MTQARHECERGGPNGGFAPPFESRDALGRREESVLFSLARCHPGVVIAP